AKTGVWNNVITTGLEFNLRELGIGIFGPDVTAPAGGGRRGRGESQNVRGDEPVRRPGEAPSELPQNEAGGPGGIMKNPNVHRVPSNNPRTPGHPPGVETPVPQNGTSTTTTTAATTTTPTDTNAHTPGVGTRGIIDDLSVNDTLLVPKAPSVPVEEITEE